MRPKALMSAALLATTSLAPTELTAQCAVPLPGLQSRNITVGISNAWGGVITSLLPSRTCQNLVDVGLPDPGREIQLAFRRGDPPPEPDCWPCDQNCDHIWNPTQGGNACGMGSGFITSESTPTELHTNAQILNFENIPFGRSNIFVDQRTRIPKGSTIEVDYTATSMESFSFTDCQEFPVAYLRSTLSTAYAYLGGAPYSRAAPQVITPSLGEIHTSEPWIAYVGSDQYGLGMYIPSGEIHNFWRIHNVASPAGKSVQSWGCFTMNPGDVKTKRAYFIYGTLDQIRSVVYEYEGEKWFGDVDDTYTEWVNRLFRNNITGGCGYAQYCPDNPIPREQMAVFLVTAKNGPAYTPPVCTGTQPFPDVPNSHPFCKWIKVAKAQGIMLGGTNENCSANNFCPSGVVTRAHMAAFLLRAKDGAGYNPPACGSPMFADVPANDFYCRWIEELARRQITGGCGGGNYCPTDSNTRAQMAVFVSVNWGLQ